MATFPHLGIAARAYVQRLRQAKAERDLLASTPTITLRNPEGVTDGEAEHDPKPAA